jgi:pyrroline-5-carboxylate reductase
MKLGFIGTGEITSAMVTGLSSGDAEQHSISLSPRNREIATVLAHRFRGVAIASSNQDVLDSCDTVVIAVRPPVARSTLSELRFRSDHCVVSVVSALSLQSVSDLVAPAGRIARAVPLPSTAKRVGPTAIYPADQLAQDLFTELGTVFPVETESEFEAMCSATATIASFYAFIDEIASWLSRNNIPERIARDYVARVFFGLLSTAVDAPERTFPSMANAHATAGGINEQFLKHLIDRGLLESISGGLDAVMERITAASSK